MNDTPLFREEVILANQANWLGAIRLGGLPRFGTVALVCTVLAGCLVAYAVFGEIARKTRLHGVLMPAGGLITITAPQAGIVERISVAQGERVDTNQPLFSLKAERLTEYGDFSSSTANTLREKLQSVQKEKILTATSFKEKEEATLQRISSLQIEQRHAESELASLNARVELSRKARDTYSELNLKGFFSDFQLQQKEEELLDLIIRQDAAKRNAQSFLREIGAAESEVKATRKSAEATAEQLSRTAATIEQEISEHQLRSGSIVVAPLSGMVSALNVHKSSYVQGGQALATIVPSESLEGTVLRAQLFAPSRTAGFIKQGDRVLIQYDAFPYQKFGLALGKILAISQSPVDVKDLPTGEIRSPMRAAASDDPLFRIDVELHAQEIITYGTSTPLKAGMTLEADVYQETRKIWEWLLEPLIAFARTR